MKKSRKKRGIGKWAQTSETEGSPLARAEEDLRRAQWVLGIGARYQPEEWLLLATLVVGAERVIRESEQQNAALRALLDEVMETFREATKDFTKSDFFSASRAARRHNRRLFAPRRRSPAGAGSQPRAITPAAGDSNAVGE